MLKLCTRAIEVEVEGNAVRVLVGDSRFQAVEAAVGVIKPRLKLLVFSAAFIAKISDAERAVIGHLVRHDFMVVGQGGE